MGAEILNEMLHLSNGFRESQNDIVLDRTIAI